MLPVHEEGTNENNGEDTQGMPCTLKRVKFVNVLDVMSVNALFLKKFTSLEELTWTSYSNSPWTQSVCNSWPGHT